MYLVYLHCNMGEQEVGIMLRFLPTRTFQESWLHWLPKNKYRRVPKDITSLNPSGICEPQPWSRFQYLTPTPIGMNGEQRS